MSRVTPEWREPETVTQMGAICRVFAFGREFTEVSGAINYRTRRFDRTLTFPWGRINYSATLSGTEDRMYLWWGAGGWLNLCRWEFA